MSDSKVPSAAREAASVSQATLSPLQRAFIALEDTRARLALSEAAPREPIAVVGLGCRIPGGADDATGFWKLLRDGVDAIGPLPADRFDIQALYNADPEVPGTIATTAGGFLRQVDTFDPSFFGIARREAQGMDPQQRLLLEVAWEALEHAAQPPDRLERSATGVYVGVCTNDYASLQLETGDRALLDAHFTSGIAHSITSGRLSYLLGLQGPSISLDTACSSSLVAIHLACQALRAGDCRMALAGGVNLILSPDIYIALSHSRMLAPDGRCKTFDAAADGFARGEGCGIVVLKKLRDAQADGDRVLAVIRGSAVNQDGPSSGLTAPNGPAQESVVREALTRAGVRPREVGYIEAHGTGTELGDPLEVHALGAVFGPDRDPSRPLLIGSVKTNVGHLEAAAGVTGVIKLVLALQHRQIPAHLNFRTPSPHIAWTDFPVTVPTTLTPWEPIDGRRIAGVSSFGFSGTNAHIVLEEAPAVDAPVANPPRQELFVLSARDEAGLRQLAGRYAAALGGRPDNELRDICFTAAVGRAQHANRAAVQANSIAELCDRLVALSDGRTVEGVRTSRVARRDPARIAFLFTGQGSQYAGMARRLYEREPAFRDALDACGAVLAAVLDRPLHDVLFGDEAAVLLDQTAYTQPALFAVEYALVQVWRAWGVTPDVVMGHSVGEIVAATVAGVMPLDAALRLIAERGRLMQSLPPGGAMAAIYAPEEEVASAIAPRAERVGIAALNGIQTTIAGTTADVQAIADAFGARGVRAQLLPVSHAFHSPLVDPILDRFGHAAATVPFARPQLRLISNLTGRLATANEVTTPGYWRRHVRDTVRFADGVRALAALAPDVCVEIGPQPTLLSFAQPLLSGSDVAMVPSLRKGRADDDQLTESLGTLFLAGHSPDWRAVYSQSPARVVELPTYPFQRERCWFKARPASGATRSGRATGHPLLGVRLSSPLREVVQFENTLAIDSVPFLQDHRVLDRAILPATAFVEMALAAGRIVFGALRDLTGVVISEPLEVTEAEARTVQVLIRRGAADEALFEILSSRSGEPNDEWRLHVQGSFAASHESAGVVESLTAIQARCTERVDAASHYAQLASRGLAFGPSLQGVQSIERRDGEALGEIALPAAIAATAPAYVMHPALLDACLQTLATALPVSTGSAKAYLPLSIESIKMHRSPGARVWSHAKVSLAAGAVDLIRASVTVRDDDGVIAELDGIALRPTAVRGADSSPFYEIEWQAQEDASWLISPGALAYEIAPALERLLREHDLESYHQGFVALESLSADWIVKAFGEMGWAPKPGDRVIAESLAANLSIPTRYVRLLARLLDILTEDGLLRRQHGESSWQVAAALPTVDPISRQASLAAEHETSRARFALAGACGAALADILRGKADPLHYLFPGGSTQIAESLYRDAPEAKAYNQFLRDTVAAAIAALPEGRRLRVLEVGAGTGGTTTWLAPALPPDRTEYLFTDVGRLMVSRARETFARFPFMEFQTLDLEQDFATQGLADRRFDIIVAANVIHATSDLRRTLGGLRQLLIPGGMLVMLEVAGFERWIDITFGLTEGWWRYTDTDLRADYPLLARPQWLDLLSSVGFEAAAVDPEHPRSREVVLVARRTDSVAFLPKHGRWLIAADRGGVGAALAAELRASDHEVVTVPPGDMKALTDLVSEQAEKLAGLIHLWTLDVDALDETAPHIDPKTPAASLGSLVSVVQALGGQSFDTDRTPRLWIVTRGAQPAAGPATLNVLQSPVWGMRKAIALEHAELRPTCVDLDPEATVVAQAASLASIIACGDERETQVAVCGRARLVPRLTRAVVATGAEAPQVRLEKSDTGVFDDMRLDPMTRRAPAAGEVEIRVIAGGLNFRDVMNAVAMRSDPEPLGGECAGRVVAIGEGVKSVAVGDDVVAIAEACFASYATTSEQYVAQLPVGLGYAQGATLPFAFMTAHHALHEVGGLTAGATVLVHAGAGGVGTAAIQLARRTGAIIIATAGSDEKRAFLKSIGVDHVLNSRTLDFADHVLSLTGGRGADMVLNSLAGDFIAAGVRCLSETGCFLEIGKRDIWSAEQFRQLRPKAQYHIVDLAAMRYEQPTQAQALFAEVMARASTGELQPLPMHTIPLSRAAEAFRFMAQARHIGKIVLTATADDLATLDSVDGTGTYLVTGGLSGLGLLTAGRLVERGARSVVLVGRRAPQAAAQDAIDAMRASGARVTIVQADVSQADEVQRLVEQIERDLPKLRGVIHSAGALDDGALLQQTWPRFTVPFGPKVDGTWALHVLTQHRPLDFFVMYSSMASVLGSSGQSNHAAANAFMDALAFHRRARGLPALSISWGAWSEVGAAADQRVDERVGDIGMGVIAPTQGLAWLDDVMRGSAPHVGVFPVRWARFLGRDATSPSVPRFLERVAETDRRRRGGESAPATTTVRSSIVEDLTHASAGRRAELLLTFVGDHVARVVGAPNAQAIDPRQPLNELGLDSLMAVELRNRIGAGLRLSRSLPATLVFDYPTLEALARYLDEVVMPASNPPMPAPVKVVLDAVGAIDELSDEQVEALFAKKLGRS